MNGHFTYDISVIIVTYYHEEYIEKALQSVLSQRTDSSLEILISDDASKDKTVAIVKNLKDSIVGDKPSIAIHSYEENVGTTQNLYDAFLRAKGKYITLLAGDDYFCNEQKLYLQKKYLEENRDCFAVAVTTESVYRDGTSTGVMSPAIEYRGKDFLQTDFARGVNYPIHGIMFRNLFYNKNIRKEFHIMAKFSKYIDDMTLCLLFFEYGMVHILNDVCYKITTRRPDDKSQHNYNTIFKGLDAQLMTIDLIIKLQRYFGTKIDMRNRLCDPCFMLIKDAIKLRKLQYLKHLKGVPLSCILGGFKNWIYRKVS